MAVPPFNSTGMDKSDLATLGQARGGIGEAPSAMSGLDAVAHASLEGIAPSTRDMLSVPTAAPVRGLSEERALSMLRDASSQSRSFFEANVHRDWQQSYRAVRNEHFLGTLYLSDAYKTRSKIFKPKTLAMLRKRLAATASALFTPGDVVTVEAEDESDERQVQSAALKQELLNYRLRTPGQRNGIPWFLTSVGARFDAEVTGMCASKQVWLYREDEDDEPQFGRPPRVLIDKPDVINLMPENVRFHPSSDWRNVAQSSPYLLLQFPMTPAEAWDKVQQNQRAQIPWLSSITEETFRNNSGGGAPSETTGPRASRGGGVDPTQQAVGEYRTVWLTEVFMRHDGRDYVYWAMNDTLILSNPTPVSKVYPWNYGERPVVIGKGSIEPHKTYQMSMVESLHHLQREANDLANLRLDYEKRIVSPPMKVLRGKKVDLQQVQRKGPNSTILMESMDDVAPMEMPDVPGSVFTESNILDQDMNDLSGVMDSGGTSARQAQNDTLGGLHLLAESGNQVSDYDTSVWIETWTVPVMQQLLRLEEYYESDAKVLAIAGQRAQMWQKYGTSEITDELLQAETTVSVNIGQGANSHPMQRLANFAHCWDLASKVFAPFVQTHKVEVDLDFERIRDDIFRNGGFRDGGKGFFQYLGPPRQPPAPPPPDPKIAVMQEANQIKAQGLQIQQEKNQGTMLLQAHNLAADQANTKLKIGAQLHGERTALDIAHMKAMAEMEGAHNQRQHEAAMAGATHASTHTSAHLTPFLSALTQRLAPPPTASGAGGGDTPQLAPKPSPKIQPQPGMYASLERPTP